MNFNARHSLFSLLLSIYASRSDASSTTEIVQSTIEIATADLVPETSLFISSNAGQYIYPPNNSRVLLVKNDRRYSLCFPCPNYRGTGPLPQNLASQLISLTWLDGARAFQANDEVCDDAWDFSKLTGITCSQHAGTAWSTTNILKGHNTTQYILLKSEKGDSPICASPRCPVSTPALRTKLQITSRSDINIFCGNHYIYQFSDGYQLSSAEYLKNTDIEADTSRSTRHSLFFNCIVGYRCQASVTTLDNAKSVRFRCLPPPSGLQSGQKTQSALILITVILVVVVAVLALSAALYKLYLARKVEVRASAESLELYPTVTPELRKSSKLDQGSEAQKTRCSSANISSAASVQCALQSVQAYRAGLLRGAGVRVTYERPTLTLYKQQAEDFRNDPDCGWVVKALDKSGKWLAEIKGEPIHSSQSYQQLINKVQEFPGDSIFKTKFEKEVSRLVSLQKPAAPPPQTLSSPGTSSSKPTAPPAGPGYKPPTNRRQTQGLIVHATDTTSDEYEYEDDYLNPLPELEIIRNARLIYPLLLKLGATPHDVSQMQNLYTLFSSFFSAPNFAQIYEEIDKMLDEMFKDSLNPSQYIKMLGAVVYKIKLMALKDKKKDSTKTSLPGATTGKRLSKQSIKAPLRKNGK